MRTELPAERLQRRLGAVPDIDSHAASAHLDPEPHDPTDDGPDHDEPRDDPNSLLPRWLPDTSRGQGWADRIRADPGRAGAVALAVIAALAVLVTVFTLIRDRTEPVMSAKLPPVEPVSPTNPRSSASPGSPDRSGLPVVVSVVGLVHTPGLVTLAPGARIADALQAAGGAVDGADTVGLNMARQLGDGEQIVVGLAPPSGQPRVLGSSVGAGTPGPAGTSGTATTGPKTAPKTAEVLDLNTATVEQLDALPGIGPVTAAAIVAWRALVTVTPSESPVSLGRGRLMFRATVQRLRDDETSGRVVVFARALDFGELMVGQPVQFRARISRPARHDLTVAVFNATGRPTVGRAGPVHRAAHIVRHRFAAAVREVLPADQATMLPALVLGDTSTVTALTSREFRAAGLTHLTAVSGANVTIVCAAALVSARLIGPRAAVVCAAVALVAFVILVQPTASVLRAAVMGAIALVGMLSARRRQAIPALSGSVLVLLAAAPHLAVDIGFALSVAATGALVVIAPVWSRRLVDRGCPKVLADALAVAAAAQLVTAPLVAAISGRVSLVAVVANLAVAAVIAPITVLGSVAAVLVVPWPAGAQVLIRFTGPEVWWVLRVAHWASGVPAATVPVAAGLPGVLLVGGATVFTVAQWRWRWFRAAMCKTMAVAVICLLAWSLSGLVGPS